MTNHNADRKLGQGQSIRVGKCITAHKKHRETVSKYIFSWRTQTAAYAVTTASVSDCSLHLDGARRSPRAAVLHDPCIYNVYFNTSAHIWFKLWDHTADGASLSIWRSKYVVKHMV